MIDTVVNTKNLKEADVVILSAPYEGGVSFMGGTSKAPKKILNCLNKNLELFDINFLCEPAKIIKTAHKEITGIKNLISDKVVRKISEEYKNLFNDKKFVIMLGGEHTVSIGALDAIAKKENPRDITIVQIDAHQDLRDDNSDYSYRPTKYAHSCAMRRPHELGFNLVQVGIRTFSKNEYEYWQKNKDTIEVFEWSEKNKHIPEIVKIIESIKTEKVYLTIDVDGFDPSCMPGTGTPAQGGIEWKYGLDLIEKIIETKNVIGADIVEVSPQKDSVLTEYGASLICYKIMANKFRNKLTS
ncbi:agmatinase [Patescibacteria group bacterium]|nr:agmatinase [Patescibacteria group bacterium]MBU1727979.1 agmatinase [Patescibacteria group bacterium]